MFQIHNIFPVLVLKWPYWDTEAAETMFKLAILFGTFSYNQTCKYLAVWKPFRHVMASTAPKRFDLAAVLMAHR